MRLIIKTVMKTSTAVIIVPNVGLFGHVNPVFLIIHWGLHKMHSHCIALLMCRLTPLSLNLGQIADGYV